ncbi:hypothetical protein Y032_0234g3120 [Ancylostoma ceylanicum]|uniref:Uncharacterized protein n=1 Tax=Ancylostoma ceylanicum TaxID=53326 RepID=A0A016SFQ8_9BILA|nr:hypothetical protein Y032_0234g3120 [Ancylostoma ceylanicum]
MISKPGFRDGVCTSLLEQIYAQRRVSSLILSIEQVNMCSPDFAAVAGSQHSLERTAPAPRSGYFDPMKTGFSST